MADWDWGGIGSWCWWLRRGRGGKREGGVGGICWRGAGGWLIYGWIGGRTRGMGECMLINVYTGR